MSLLGKIDQRTEADEPSLWGEDHYQPSGLRLDGAATAPEPNRQRRCASLECTSTWKAPWRSRRVPIFEGQWGCSGRCVLSMVRAAIKRERGEAGIAQAPELHRHRVPLGLVMLAQGWITHPQLQQALQAQRNNGSGRIGDWLISECGLPAEQVTRGLGVQWGCPVLSLDGFSPKAMALVVPRALTDEFGMLPVRVAGGRLLYLGFEDRLDAAAALAIERMSGLKTQSGLVESGEFRSARARLQECGGAPAKREAVEDEDALAAKVTAVVEQKQPAEARLVRVHQYYWLRLWTERGTANKADTAVEGMLDYLYSVGGRT